MKTPDEIKKCLDRCLDRWTPVHFVSCESDCPYHSEGAGCKNVMHSDAIAYIQQLETELDDEKNKNEILIFDNDKLMEEIAQVERERDAAIKDLSDRCLYCKHAANDMGSGTCRTCFQRRGEHLWAPMVRGNFEWRGVCSENTKEEPNAD